MVVRRPTSPTCASACSSSPTTPPRPSPRCSTGCRRPSVDSVDHVLVCDDASHDDTYDVGLGYQSDTDLPARRRPAPARTSATAATRRPATLGDRARPRHRRAAARRRPVRPGGHRDLVAPLVRGEADAVFGSRMMRARAARAGGMPLLQVRRQPDPDDGPEQARRPRAQRVAQRLPRLPRRRARRPAVRAQHRRLRLRHRDHPGAARGGEAHRRGADPDLLRRRDLLRQRPALRQGRHRRRAALPAAQDRLRRGRARRSQHDAATSSSRRRTPRTACCSRGSRSRRRRRVLDVGCSDGRFAALVREPGHHVTGVDLVKHEGVGDRVDAFVEADLNQGLPAEIGGDFDVVVAGRRPRARRSTRTRLLDELVGTARTRGRDPRLRARTSGTGTRAPGWRSAASTTTSAAPSTTATSASSPAAASSGCFAARAGDPRAPRRRVPFGVCSGRRRPDVGRPTRARGAAVAPSSARRGAWPTLFAYQFLYLVDADERRGRPPGMLSVSRPTGDQCRRRRVPSRRGSTAGETPARHASVRPEFTEALAPHPTRMRRSIDAGGDRRRFFVPLPRRRPRDSRLRRRPRDGRFAPFRTAVATGFSNFYDLQARALLAGHLRPGQSLSIRVSSFVATGTCTSLRCRRSCASPPPRDRPLRRPARPRR